MLEDDLAWLAEAEALLAAPMDVNSVRLEDLLTIPWLRPSVAAAIVRARDSLGRFESLRQLADVPGIDQSTLAVLEVLPRSAQMPVRAMMTAGAATDSLHGGWRSLSSIVRLRASAQPWDASLLAEKDPGEASWADYVAAGVEYRLPRLRMLLGNFTLACGQGLVLSGPAGRSRYGPGNAGAGRVLRLATSVDETRYLRGVGVARESGRASLQVCLSSAARDARLGPDGSVVAFRPGGRHDDSASLAQRRQVAEWSAAVAGGVAMTGWGLGGCIAASRFDRTVAPPDTLYAFVGRDLVAGSVSAGGRVGPYQLGVELAGSTPRGLAVATFIDGTWQDLDAEATVRWRSDRFFAPYGRWTALSGRRRRFDGSGNLRYRLAPATIGVSGSTYRDSDAESLPGRLEAVVQQDLGRVDLELRAGQRYRGNLPTLTTTRLTARIRASSAWSAQAVVAYEAEPRSGGSGMVTGLRAWGKTGPVRLGVAAARFTIPGGDVRMSWYEPGPRRTGRSFSADTSCWRVAATAGVELRQLRLACGVAGSPLGPARAELSAEVEVGLKRG